MRLTRRSHVPSLSIICTLAFALFVALTPLRYARAQAQNTQTTSQTNAAPQGSVTQQSPTTNETHVFHITVTDERWNIILGVTRDNVTAFDGGARREIVSFAAEDMPASVTFLVDTSSSSFSQREGRLGVRRVAALKDSVAAFVRDGNPANEYSLTAFNQQPQILLENSGDARALLAALERLASADLRGQTALNDALYTALYKIASRPARKRVLILLSDGEENVSKYAFDDVMREVRESDVIVYVVTPPSLDDGSPIVYDARNKLEELARASGGAVFYPQRESAMSEALKQIASELRGQYEVTIATEPNAKGDGWHDVRFKLGELHDARGRRVKAMIRTRRGFYEAGAPRRQ